MATRFPGRIWEVQSVGQMNGQLRPSFGVQLGDFALVTDPGATGGLYQATAVAGPGFTWTLRAGGGGGGDWATVLAAGNQSGANDALIDEEQLVAWGNRTGPPITSEPTGWRTARRLETFVGGGFTAMGSPIAVGPIGLLGTRAIIKARCVTRQGVGGGAVSDFGVLEEVWTSNASVWSMTTSITGVGAVFRLQATGANLNLEVNDVVAGPGTAYAMVDVVFQPGSNPG